MDCSNSNVSSFIFRAEFVFALTSSDVGCNGGTSSDVSVVEDGVSSILQLNSFS